MTWRGEMSAEMYVTSGSCNMHLVYLRKPLFWHTVAYTLPTGTINEQNTCCAQTELTDTLMSFIRAYCVFDIVFLHQMNQNDGVSSCTHNTCISYQRIPSVWKNSLSSQVIKSCFLQAYHTRFKLLHQMGPTARVICYLSDSEIASSSKCGCNQCHTPVTPVPLF